MGLLVAGGSRGLFCLLLPGVPELDNGVKGGNGAGGKLHLLVTVLPVHLGAGHGSVVTVVPALCGSAEDVLLGEHLSEGCVRGQILLRAIGGGFNDSLAFCVAMNCQVVPPPQLQQCFFSLPPSPNPPTSYLAYIC